MSSLVRNFLNIFTRGPASATDNAAAIYDGTTGKLIKDSRVIYSTSGTGFQLNATGNEAKIRQAADTFGASSLSLQNRFGAAGAVFYNEGLDLFDFAFVPSSLSTGNIRWEHRSSGGKLAANTEGEFEFIEPVATTIWLRSGVGETRIISGIFTITGTTTSLGSTTTGITSTTTNISGTTLNISDTTTNISSTNVNVARAAAGGGAILRIANTQAAGAVQYGQLIVEADNSASNRAFLNQLSSSWVTSGINFASGTALEASAAGGLSVAATQAAGAIRFYTGGTTLRAQMASSGKLAIGNITPTAFLHLLAGTASANTAPLKFTSGTNLTTAEAGVHEYNGNHYLTNSAIRFPIGGVLFDHYVDVNNTTTTETDLYTDTLAASTLANNGDKVVATYQIVCTGAALASQEMRVYFGGTLIYDSGALSIGAITANFTFNITVIRESSTVVRCWSEVSTDFATLFPYSKYTRVTGLTLSNTQIIKITGQASGAGAASNQITSVGGFVEFKPGS